MIASLVLVLGTIGWASFLVGRQMGETVVFERLADAGRRVHTVFTSGSISADLPLAELSRDDIATASERLPTEYIESASGELFVVHHHEHGQVSSLSADGIELPRLQLVPGASRQGTQQLTSGTRLLYWAGGYRDRGQEVTVAVYSDATRFHERLLSMSWLALAAGLVLVVALLFVQHLILRRTTSRLDAIRADIERLGHGEILALPEDVPEEVRPLVVEFNLLLQRFDHRLRQSRNALGNLAHSLKGPLNLLIRAADDSHEASVVKQNAVRIHQLIDGELRRARLVGRTSAGRRFDLAAELDTLGGLLAQVHTGKSVDIRLAEGAGVEILHDRQDMLELIGNLLDNAVKWAESTVMVNARHADGLLLEIEDDGPGVSDEELVRLTERGVRLDESVAGHGLGLAIVKDIVATYNGELELDRSVRLGGLRVSIRLPEHRSAM